jgi:protein-disulfide isomerase
LKRREILQLLTILAIAWAASMLLRHNRPVGHDVRANPTTASVLKDTVSPRLDVPSADLTLVVFTDYQCPACKTVYGPMERAVAKDGKVRVIYKDWPIFGPRSERVARIAIAANLQSIYPQLHGLLMGELRTLSDDVIRDNLEKAGGSWELVIAMLDEQGASIDRQIARNAQQAGALRLPGTPGFLIGTILVTGAISEGDFGRAFAQARAQQKKSG